jgi:hypothetical protein
MNNVYTRPDSEPVDICAKNNTYSNMSSGLKIGDFGIETDTGLWCFRNVNDAYKRCAPKSESTTLYLPVCDNSTTGHLKNSRQLESASTLYVNYAQGDYDFIVSGNSKQYGIVYDAGLNRVSIGAASPSFKLSISDANPVISLTDSDTGAIALIDSASSTGRLNIDADALNTVASSKINLRVDGDNCIEIDGNGDVVVSKGDLIIPEGKGLYFCASGTDKGSTGTLRMTKSGNDILTERWDGGSWV